MSLARFDINLGGNSRGYVILEAVRGKRAAAGLLVQLWTKFRIEGMQEGEEVVLTSIRGEMSLVLADGGAVWLSELHTGIGQSLVTSEAAFDREVIFSASLGPWSVEAVERATRGQDVRFRIALDAAASWACGASQFQATQEVTVARHVWSQVLKESGYAESVIVEIFAPRAADDSGLPKAFEHLQSALQARDRGDYREAIAVCRSALECLPVLAGQSQDTYGKSRVKTSERERSKEERLQELRNVLMDLCSAAHHADEVTERFIWKRDDAMVAIATTSSLLSQMAD